MQDLYDNTIILCEMESKVRAHHNQPKLLINFILLLIIINYMAFLEGGRLV